MKQSTVNAIPLRRSISIKVRQDNNGVDVFSKEFPGMVGSGEDLERALQMFFDHLMIDYYDYSLNPDQDLNENDRLYGVRLKRLFNSERRRNRLLKSKACFGEDCESV
jgi:hypothetical protein